MRAGELRHRVEIQRASSAPQDSYGQPIPVLATIATVWAAIRPLTARELLAAQQVQAEVSHKITIRYTDIKHTDKMKFGTRLFSVVGIRNLDERKEELEITALEKPAV